MQTTQKQHKNLQLKKM